MPQVDRTRPGSRNDWRITYDTGSQKWTDDRPGDGVGPAGGEQLAEALSEPAVQRGLSAIQTAIKGGQGLKPAVDALVRDTGTEKGRTVLNAVYKGAKKAESPEVDGWDAARKMVASGECPFCGAKVIQRCRCSGPHNVEQLRKGHGSLCENGHRWSGDQMVMDVEGAEQAKAAMEGLAEMLGRPCEAGVRGMVQRIVLDVDSLAERVADFWRMKNQRSAMVATDRDKVVEQLCRSKDKGVKAFIQLLYSIWNVGKADWKAARKEMMKYPSGRKVVRGMEALPHFEEISRDDGGYWKLMKSIPREEKNAVDKEWEAFERRVLRPLEGEMVDHYLKRGVVAAVMDRVDPDALPTLWFENEAGDKFVPDMSGDTEPETPPKDFNYQHSQFSDLRHSVLKIVQQEDVDACDHPASHVKKDLGMDPAYGEGEECRKCGGQREKPVGGEWGPWKAVGSREVMVVNSGWPEDLMLAIANGGVRPQKAIQISALACERCMNALAHEFGLDWGYPEGSEEWRAAGTECDFCRGMGHVREPVGDRAAGIAMRVAVGFFDIAAGGGGEDMSDDMADRVAARFTAGRTFEVYGDEYPLDSKYAKVMAQYFAPPEKKYPDSVREWEAVRDWAVKARAKEKDVKALLNAVDMGAAGHVLGGRIRGVSDVRKIADRLRLSFNLVSADDMEEYCPDCARQIRAGEVAMTWDGLRELLNEHGKAGD